MRQKEFLSEQGGKETNDAELMRVVAESTNVLKRAAAELRRKAKERSREGMDVGAVRVGYQYVLDAYEKKAVILEALADQLSRDAAETARFIETEGDDSKKRILLQYELLKARTIASMYAFFNRIEELTPSDLDYRRLQEEAADSLREQEERRKKKITPFHPRPPKFLLRIVGFSEEEIERWL